MEEMPRHPVYFGRIVIDQEIAHGHMVDKTSVVMFIKLPPYTVSSLRYVLYVGN